MSTLITYGDELTHFTAVFSEVDLAIDIASRLSCIEVDALAGLLRTLGELAAADTWIQQHATDDGIGDVHYQGDTLEFLVPIDPMNGLPCDSCQEPHEPTPCWRGLNSCEAKRVVPRAARCLLTLSVCLAVDRSSLPRDYVPGFRGISSLAVLPPVFHGPGTAHRSPHPRSPCQTGEQEQLEERGS